MDESRERGVFWDSAGFIQLANSCQVTPHKERSGVNELGKHRKLPT